MSVYMGSRVLTNSYAIHNYLDGNEKFEVLLYRKTFRYQQEGEI